MPERKYPIADANPAAKLTDRIISSLNSQPAEKVEETSGVRSKADLGRIETYLYWNAFDHDRPK